MTNMEGIFFLIETMFDALKVDLFKIIVNSIDADDIEGINIRDCCINHSKMFQSLKLRGEHLQKTGHHEKAMSCLFHEKIELLEDPNSKFRACPDKSCTLNLLQTFSHEVYEPATAFLKMQI